MQEGCAKVALIVPEFEHPYIEGSFKMLMLAENLPAGNA
jgi:hypothetical protein